MKEAPSSSTAHSGGKRRSGIASPASAREAAEPALFRCSLLPRPSQQVRQLGDVGGDAPVTLFNRGFAMTFAAAKRGAGSQGRDRGLKAR
jgi:hypothetical protein